MHLKYCTACGNELTRITSKTSKYKAVCRLCELTYKFVTTDQGELISVNDCSPSQSSEAAINATINKVEKDN